MKKSKKIQVSVPNEVTDLFNWIKKYDPLFNKKSDSEILESFFVKGIKNAYEESLKNAEPLDNDIYEKVAKTSKKAIQDYSNSIEEENAAKFKFNDGGLLKKLRAKAKPLDPNFIKKALKESKRSFKKAEKKVSVFAKLSKKEFKKLIGD
jgi:uncharacterized protein YoxC